MSYELLQVQTIGHGPRRTVVLTLNRPKQLNALNEPLMEELALALRGFDADPGIGCIVLTGNDRAFAAGADIATMSKLEFLDAYMNGFITRNWEELARMRKPTIAAVAGYALGGGCELALMCDFIIAADNAIFGQPEIKLGIMPGAGGTQRLPRAIGKAKAMEMILTGRTMDAAEAESAGLVSRVVPVSELMNEVLATAESINKLSAPSLAMAKESVNRAFESSLSDSVQFERRVFHSLFATRDQKEGMNAFLAKRTPQFQHR